MNRIQILTIALLGALASYGAEPLPVIKRGAPMPRQAQNIDFSGITRSENPSGSTLVTAGFSVKGHEGAQTTVWSENFDNGASAWTIDPTTYVTWTTKRIAAPGESKSFSSIDPDDRLSLYVEGPYQQYRREISSATSGLIPVPEKGAELHAYIGYTLNYDDQCRLAIYASADGFETSELLWSSERGSGERPWAWRKVDLSLAAYAGKQIQIRFTYGPGSADSFNTGGYMGDFAIDGLSVTGAAPVEHVDVATGEELTFVDLSQGDVQSYHWSMPGATPSESSLQSPTVIYTADGTYDVSLTVTDINGDRSTLTHTALVNVTGRAPVARINPAASFRYAATRRFMVAPMAPVRFTDGSDGYPDSWDWSFSGVSATPYEPYFTSEESPVVRFSYLHNQDVTLTVANSHGESSAIAPLSVEYSGTVTNLQPDDQATVFNMEDWGVFPGSNTRKITAYAEKFSRPSCPVMITGAYVFFNRADATELTDQIADVGVHLYTSENGLPGRKLDSMWWRVFELDLPTSSGELQGTAFPFTDCPIVDDEFFIVVDGIPEYSETCLVSFGMAGFRDSGNTAYMLKDGQWIDCSTYFPAGANHTSFMIYPEVSHSVMSVLDENDVPLTDPVYTINAGATAGTAKVKVFSYLGYESPVACDTDWARVTSQPNGMTVDELTIEYDALPAGMTQREAMFTLTDKASELPVRLVQKAGSGIDGVTPERPAAEVEAVFSIEGRRLSSTLTDLPKGVYIVRYTDGTTVKLAR